MASIPGNDPLIGAAPAVAGERVKARAQARQRLAFLIMLFPVLALIILVRLVDLSVIQGTPGSETKLISAAPPRGDIVDRNGVELARTFEAYAITVIPRRLTSDPEVLATKLAEILPERTRDEILTDLTSSKGLRYLARRVLPGQARRINDLGEPAIELTREAERLYPNINLAAQALGYTDDDGHGLIGVEKAFDQRLADPVQRAAPLALSIDVRVQQAMQNELAALVADQNAKGAAGVDALIEKGEVILAYRNGVRDSHVKRAVPCTLLGLGARFKARCVNASTLASEIGNAICKDGAELAVVWMYDLQKRHYYVSLRRDSDEVDVSLIAKALGGGGHRRASGFTCESLEGVLCVCGRRRSARVGTSASSACVYGWFGASNSSAAGADSTIRPRYMISTRSARWRITPRSWLMNR
jgi:hypothetical protein